ncbi:MAG TPA: hypothetical protein VJB34_05400 [Bdellovibrionota bacterium]|nr:hypothetical protein [Bdellovibrionota bacterium]
MKAILIIYDKELDSEVISLLHGAEITDYTKLIGIEGKKLEHDIYESKNNYACYVALPAEKAYSVFQEFSNFKKNKLRKNFGVAVFLIPIEEMT